MDDPNEKSAEQQGMNESKEADKNMMDEVNNDRKGQGDGQGGDQQGSKGGEGENGSPENTQNQLGSGGDFTMKKK